MRRSRVSLLNRSKILSPSNFTGAPNQTVNINVSGTNAIVRDKNNVSDENKKNSINDSVAGINAIDKDIVISENSEKDSVAGINANVDENNENNEKIVTEINVNEVPHITYDEASFLRFVLSLYMEKNIITEYNEIICSENELKRLITLLTGCDNCIITAVNPLEDISCCSINNITCPYMLITKIQIVYGEKMYIFKYVRSDLIALFDEYRISLKFIKNI